MHTLAQVSRMRQGTLIPNWRVSLMRLNRLIKVGCVADFLRAKTRVHTVEQPNEVRSEGRKAARLATYLSLKLIESF